MGIIDPNKSFDQPSNNLSDLTKDDETHKAISDFNENILEKLSKPLANASSLKEYHDITVQHRAQLSQKISEVSELLQTTGKIVDEDKKILEEVSSTEVKITEVMTSVKKAETIKQLIQNKIQELDLLKEKKNSLISDSQNITSKITSLENQSIPCDQEIKKLNTSSEGMKSIQTKVKSEIHQLEIEILKLSQSNQKISLFLEELVDFDAQSKVRLKRPLTNNELKIETQEILGRELDILKETEDLLENETMDNFQLSLKKTEIENSILQDRNKLENLEESSGVTFESLEAKFSTLNNELKKEEKILEDYKDNHTALVFNKESLTDQKSMQEMFKTESQKKLDSLQPLVWNNFKSILLNIVGLVFITYLYRNYRYGNDREIEVQSIKQYDQSISEFTDQLSKNKFLFDKLQVDIKQQELKIQSLKNEVLEVQNQYEQLNAKPGQIIELRNKIKDSEKEFTEAENNYLYSNQKIYLLQLDKQSSSYKINSLTQQIECLKTSSEYKSSGKSIEKLNEIKDSLNEKQKQLVALNEKIAVKKGEELAIHNQIKYFDSEIIDRTGEKIFLNVQLKIQKENLSTTNELMHKNDVDLSNNEKIFFESLQQDPELQAEFNKLAGGIPKGDNFHNYLTQLETRIPDHEKEITNKRIELEKKISQILGTNKNIEPTYRLLEALNQKITTLKQLEDKLKITQFKIQNVLKVIDQKKEMDLKKTEEENEILRKQNESFYERVNDVLDIKYAKTNDPSEITLLKEKQKLLKEYLDPAVLKFLSNNIDNFPFLLMAFAQVRENFKNINSEMDSQGMQVQLKQTIAVQLTNISVISNLIEKLKTEGLISENALLEFTLTPTDTLESTQDSKRKIQIKMSPLESSLNKLILPYFNGKTVLEETEVDYTLIKNKLIEFSKTVEVRPDSPVDLTRKRASSPVTTASIRLESKLFDAIRIGKSWATHQADLTKEGKSYNQVFKLKNPNDANVTEAYYKEAKKGGEAGGAMEKLMWDIAVLFGLEDQFTPTTVTSLRTEKELVSGTGQENDVILEGGELKKVDHLGKARKGGIQAAQAGKTLEEITNEGKELSIPRNEVIQGILTICEFGMFDAHQENLIIDENGKIRFFDNTRSMPHSNGCILWRNTVQPTLRCGLLRLQECYNRFSDNERDKIFKQISTQLSKMDQLQAFLNNPDTKKMIQKMPKDWVNPTDVFDAMKERLTLMKQAIRNPKVTNLAELTLASQPDMKFIAVLQYMRDPSITSYIGYNDFYTDDDLLLKQKTYLQVSGYDNYPACLERCVNKNVDPSLIKSWCDDPNLSLLDVTRKIYDCQERIPTSIANQNAKALYVTMKAKSKVDKKDII